MARLQQYISLHIILKTAFLRKAALVADQEGFSKQRNMEVHDVSEEKTNSTRLTRLLVDGGTHVLKEFLHSIFPRDKLQIVLGKNRPKLQSLKREPCNIW